MRRSLFITLEGGEGSGKSTQGKLLHAWIQGQGMDAVLTREPGGTPEGEEIRAMVLNGDKNKWEKAAEVLLFNAARVQHIKHKIAPNLQAGRHVICDRYTDSTRVYQDFGSGMKPGWVKEIQDFVVGDYTPDVTLIFDIPVTVGLQRAKSRGDTELRFECKGNDFHEIVREGFRQIANTEPERCKLIDANQTIETVHAEVISHVQALLQKHSL